MSSRDAISRILTAHRSRRPRLGFARSFLSLATFFSSPISSPLPSLFLSHLFSSPISSSLPHHTLNPVRDSDAFCHHLEQPYNIPFWFVFNTLLYIAPDRCNAESTATILPRPAFLPVARLDPAHLRLTVKSSLQRQRPSTCILRPQQLRFPARARLGTGRYLHRRLFRRGGRGGRRGLLPRAAKEQ